MKKKINYRFWIIITVIICVTILLTVLILSKELDNETKTNIIGMFCTIVLALGSLFFLFYSPE